MSRKRHSETIIETHEVWVVRRHQGRAASLCCAQCTGWAAMFTPEAAARLLSVSPRTIYRWVEAGRLHFTETPDGGLLVCTSSLMTADIAPL